MILFGIQTENNRVYYLDKVSVVSINQPGTELLQNGNLESTTMPPTDWSSFCSSTCGSSPDTMVNSTYCYPSYSNCYKGKCPGPTGIEFLGQSFTASIGTTYTVSFWLIEDGSGTSSSNRFTVDVI